MASVSVVEDVPPADYSKHGLTREKLLWMWRKMVEIRLFEEKVEELFLVKGLLIGPAHLCYGQEAIAVGAVAALRSDDPIISNHRGHGHALAKDIPPRLVMAELFGKAAGTCKGLGGSMHVAIYPEKGALYSSAIVGSGIPIAVGVGLALQREKAGRVAAVFFGDGAVNTGAFHEGMNLAALWRVPVLFICENNMYAMSTKVERTMAVESIAARGLAYGVNCMAVNGNDVAAVYAATAQAAERARRGEGPTFLECKTYRRKGHGVYDKAEYRPPGEVEEGLKKDPLTRFRRVVLEAGLLTAAEMDSLENEVKREVEDSVKFAQSSNVLSFSELEKYVYFVGE
ncbi:thiamine pyrophosphate-dependent dehydrogenase E1 component subunit alpha [Candidatus Hecatella orcuttiae]|uniref:thiamine pyrophosphate-dependent dehydrogenase E1 component subunit alpha n=1 Tax=Candidatus Hecatella orcuttiae TaxID=1935119 RepID=UPI002867C1AE|nr:thiamine pyrophosphate-dependent dehydrogenase E1 component subunit alpha [Candidatus Hecatella orcuttiae]